MTKPPPARPPQRFVYVIGPTEGLQKVGIATDPQIRLSSLQTGCPFELQIHIAVPVPFGEAHAIERRAHGLLARSRVRSEWFSVSPAEAIAAVQAAAGVTRALGHDMSRSGALPLLEFRAFWRKDLFEEGG